MPHIFGFCKSLPSVLSMNLRLFYEFQIHFFLIWFDRSTYPKKFLIAINIINRLKRKEYNLIFIGNFRFIFNIAKVTYYKKEFLTALNPINRLKQKKHVTLNFTDNFIFIFNVAKV